MRLTTIYFIIINSNASLYWNHWIMILSHLNPTIGREDEKAPSGSEEVILQNDMHASLHAEVTHKITTVMSIHAATVTMPLYSTSSSELYSYLILAIFYKCIIQILLLKMWGSKLRYKRFIVRKAKNQRRYERLARVGFATVCACGLYMCNSYN